MNKLSIYFIMSFLIIMIVFSVIGCDGIITPNYIFAKKYLVIVESIENLNESLVELGETKIILSTLSGEEETDNKIIWYQDTSVVPYQDTSVVPLTIKPHQIISIDSVYICDFTFGNDETKYFKLFYESDVFKGSSRLVLYNSCKGSGERILQKNNIEKDILQFGRPCDGKDGFYYFDINYEGKYPGILRIKVKLQSMS